ncbi:hypothetical protein D3C76_486900 [compost metagenome]|jgi:hypothetical protein|uniref:Uncharacterized protein n=1 Tax=Pseudomonas fluorescens TaxID=294 RepID=A0A5E6SN66_PSEFL|nr:MULTISPECIES: hypothetical protein [Pseudomonas]MBV7524072.1 hypothetical protein [Pseudomonas sp. PDM29]QHF40725.1 hypothetical protein PspS34_21620 [Pseudomonas sp. S34]VVM81817.1 hypothetical protein PS673_02323 [Pseudomonas fluorescens]VVO69486.1 hypothetical protein PS893_01208 [Pseudomonas fluorescens]VVO79879.1 hypothetical protein PS843_01718 [Pseudomonas fluorescens]
MTVKVTERDDSHKSHEGVAAGIRIWDVHQQDLLVGMFHSEIDAQNYRAELEILERNRELATG